jgi:hypothetical protein
MTAHHVLTIHTLNMINVDRCFYHVKKKKKMTQAANTRQQARRTFARDTVAACVASGLEGARALRGPSSTCASGTAEVGDVKAAARTAAPQVDHHVPTQPSTRRRFARAMAEASDAV